MKNIILYIALTIAVNSCEYIGRETVHGNGNMQSEQRSLATATKIDARGFFDVDIVQGSSPSVKIDADGNLLQYIETKIEGDRLIIKAKEGYNLSSDNKITVHVTTDKLEEVELYGSGNVTSDAKFTGADNLKLGIYGSGDMKIQVNTPRIESVIAGNGSISLSGESKDTRIEIDGSGDYKAENLQAENAEIHIAGSGGAKVSASTSLDVHIAGSGDVFYKGSPSIKTSIAGSGNIRQM